jgi:hypothetical protein
VLTYVIMLYMWIRFKNPSNVVIDMIRCLKCEYMRRVRMLSSILCFFKTKTNYGMKEGWRWQNYHFLRCSLLKLRTRFASWVISMVFWEIHGTREYLWSAKEISPKLNTFIQFNDIPFHTAQQIKRVESCKFFKGKTVILVPQCATRCYSGPSLRKNY